MRKPCLAVHFFALTVFTVRKLSLMGHFFLLRGLGCRAGASLSGSLGGSLGGSQYHLPEP